MSISVIVSTSPGREIPLHYVLECLTRQNWRDFEVLVVDDGSTGAEAICQRFNPRLPLTYLWRSNDFCVSRSRNLGAQAARFENLVFLDGDILLNPLALAAYQNNLSQYPLIYGYYGNILSLITPSIWFPEMRVKFFDSRFFYQSPDILRIPPDFWQRPQLYAWSGNCGLQRSVYEALGGFDEGFVGWGMEDIELAARLDKSGYQLNFALEVWGEHLEHTLAERVFINYQAQLDTTQEIQPATQPPLVLGQTNAQELASLFFLHYLPRAEIVLFEENPDLQGYYGFVLESQGQLELALAHYQQIFCRGKAELQGPSILEVLRWTVQPEAVLELCEKYVLNVPGLSCQIRGKICCALGQVLAEQGHHGLAQVYYQKSSED